MFKKFNVLYIFIIFAYLLSYANTKKCFVLPKENQETENQELENKEPENQEPCVSDFVCACSTTDNESCKTCCSAETGCTGGLGSEGCTSGPVYTNAFECYDECDEAFPVGE